MIIEVHNLTKKYKDKIAVDGIDLFIEEGEIFGLLGPNGAGKSTTINTLLGLLKINGGTVQFFGKDYSKNGREIKKYIGYVPQEYAFFETLSAIDNVKYWARIYGLKGEEREKAVRQALEFTRLWERRKDRADIFSGGMKRRLNIACAIVHKPKILFMDEPTVGVDPQSRNNILESVKELNRSGTTVIYTSHYMEEIEEICNRVAIMDFGKVIACGTIDELVESVSEHKKMSLEVSGDENEAAEIIQGVPGVREVSLEEKVIHITMEKDQNSMSAVIETLVNKGFHISSMVLEKSNLETVFLQLTGKKLRD